MRDADCPCDIPTLLAPFLSSPQSAVASPDGQPSLDSLRTLAARYIVGMAETTYHLLANPAVPIIQGTIIRSDEDPRGQLAGDAQMDAALEQLGLSENQLDAILQVRATTQGIK